VFCIWYVAILELLLDYRLSYQTAMSCQQARARSSESSIHAEG
jgi:hypothetical protein